MSANRCTPEPGATLLVRQYGRERASQRTSGGSSQNLVFAIGRHDFDGVHGCGRASSTTTHIGVFHAVSVDPIELPAAWLVQIWPTRVCGTDQPLCLPASTDLTTISSRHAGNRYFYVPCAVMIKVLNNTIDIMRDNWPLNHLWTS